MGKECQAWVWLTAFGLSLGWAIGARAQNQPTPDRYSGEGKSGRHAGQIGAELASYLRNDDQSFRVEISPILTGWYGVADGVDLKLDWGFAFLDIAPDQGDSQGAACIGNPTLSVQRVVEASRTRISFGLAIAAPLSSIATRPKILDSEPRTNDWDSSAAGKYLRRQYAYQTASAMRGRWNHWLWMPEHFGLALPAGAKMVSREHILLGGEAAMAVLIPTGSYQSDQAAFDMQFAGEIGFGFESVETGMRLQGVLMPLRSEENGAAQFSVAPFVRVDLAGSYLNAAVMFNLDEPWGAFGRGKDTWGLLLGGGANF